MSRTTVVFIFALGLPWLFTPQAFANVTVTAATGGTGLSADLATNGAAPGFTTLGNIQIQEPSNPKGDFAIGTNVTLILTAPTGWRFNAGVGSVSWAAGNNISTASVSVAA